MRSPRVAFVIFDGFQTLDLAGPHEVFQRAGGYSCAIVAPRRGLIRADSGLPIHAEHGVDTLSPHGVDTLVVAGGSGVDEARHDPRLTGWITDAAARARRATSVCSGALLLPETGLLDGHRVTTH
ncbi:DJ-1/PfpI family protein [Nocardiopsis sp. NPDC049922]|uniref:DJ-1/PfpI family protein n=1 Tax=Nocardiopsis sp. NPDC049922 TaxID=3155157 RepID=UPI0033C2F52C